MPELVAVVLVTCAARPAWGTAGAGLLPLMEPEKEQEGVWVEGGDVGAGGDELGEEGPVRGRGFEDGAEGE